MKYPPEPCPGCAGLDLVAFTAPHEHGVRAVCQSCGWTAPIADSRALAIANWNRRAPLKSSASTGREETPASNPPAENRDVNDPTEQTPDTE